MSVTQPTRKLSLWPVTKDTVNLVNQSQLEGNKADAKPAKPCASQSRLILALILIGWESYVSFCQSRSVAMLKQSKFELLSKPKWKLLFKKNFKKFLPILVICFTLMRYKIPCYKSAVFPRQWPYFGGREHSCNKTLIEVTTYLFLYWSSCIWVCLLCTSALQQAPLRIYRL